ncbi:MAG: ATP-binding protein [Planctomycetota bacterium]
MTLSATFCRTVTVDGSPGPVRSLRTLLTSFLVDRSVPDETVRAIVLAFGEALDNAWEHGTSGSGEVRVRVRYSPRFVVVSLLDPGSDKVPLGRPVVTTDASERGRGFQLMNKLMDEVRVRSFPTGGTLVSMMRRLDGSR